LCELILLAQNYTMFVWEWDNLSFTPYYTYRLHQRSPPLMASSHHLSTHTHTIVTQANFLPPPLSLPPLPHFLSLSIQLRTTQLHSGYSHTRWRGNTGGERERERERERTVEGKSAGLWTPVTGRRSDGKKTDAKMGHQKETLQWLSKLNKSKAFHLQSRFIYQNLSIFIRLFLIKIYLKIYFYLSPEENFKTCTQDDWKSFKWI